jgi:hypothetical protein
VTPRQFALDLILEAMLAGGFTAWALDLYQARRRRPAIGVCTRCAVAVTTGTCFDCHADDALMIASRA